MKKMLSLKTFIVCLLASAALHGMADQPQDTSWREGKYEKYFDTRTFMATANTPGIRQALIKEEGFTPVDITTKDNVKLSGLLRKCDNAAYSIIVCAGFFPGRKEGMATLVPMLPKNCNILFVDARGHGESTGRFWSTLPSYGQKEYQDVIAAIDYMHTQDDKPLFVHAICVGTFHATRALLTLEEQNLINHYRVEGMIFDSGFGSLVNATSIPKTHIKNKILPGALIAALYHKDTKDQVKQRLLYRASWACIAPLLTMIEWIIKPYLKKSDPDINLFDRIKTLSTPVFYIHSHDDTYTPIQPVMDLSEKTAHKTTWWLENSEHTLHHIKHKDAYRERLLAFLHTASDTKKKSDTHLF